MSGGLWPWSRRPDAPPPEAPDPGAAPAAEPVPDPVLDWAQANVAPWAARVGASSGEVYAAFLDGLNRTRHDVFVFDLADGRVRVREKRVHHPLAYNRRIEHFRVGLYRDHLQEALAAAGPLPPVSVAVVVADIAHDLPPDQPVFAYQRTSSQGWILIPDVEMLELDFYDEEAPDVAPDGKVDRIVFSGSSTGEPLDEAAVRGDRSQRLRFAARFVDDPVVEFTIGRVAECTSPEAEALLRAKPYFRRVDWFEQQTRRYVLSLDGNGATCSRVMRTLRSRSVLLKVRSDHQLFFLPGLTPWTHYLPVEDEEDLARLAPEITRPDFPSDAVCDAANAFCRRHLSHASVVRYTAQLLRLFGTTYVGRLS